MVPITPTWLAWHFIINHFSNSQSGGQNNVFSLPWERKTILLFCLPDWVEFKGSTGWGSSEPRQIVLFNSNTFLIGECITCHGSELTTSLGGTKLTNSLGKQQLELSTRMWWNQVPWNHGKFVCQSTWCQKATEAGKRILLEKACITWEEEFIIAKTY